MSLPCSPAGPRLVVDRVSKEYGGGAHRVLAVAEVSFEIAAGEIVALLGPNGAGKTTTVKMICGLVAPTAGAIRIAGLDLQRQFRDALTQVGAVLEGSRNIYWRLTVEENVEYFGCIRNRGGLGLRARVNAVLEMLGLGPVRRRVAQTLSRGMQQRAAIACALVAEPQVLLLDEPTLALDHESSETVKAEVRRLAREEGTAVLLTTHQLDLAQELATRIGVIRRGRLVTLDTLDRLRRLFSVGQYEVCVAGSLDSQSLTGLSTWQPLRVCHQEDGCTTITLTTDDPGHLYLLLDAVRPRPVLLARQVAPDLSEIYLRVLEREG